MARVFAAAAAQLGPIETGMPRAAVVARLLRLMEEAHAVGCRFVVYPEMALPPFFQSQYITDATELAGFFETRMPGPDTQSLFDAARRLGVGFYLGYCEHTEGGGETRYIGYNTSILVDHSGRIVGKYRKVHLPGNATSDENLKLQHLEPWYFFDGDLGFPVTETMGGRWGMVICNDRRWPEAWRMLGLQGAEIVTLGYNSPSLLPDHPAQNALRKMHHLMPMQAATYQNGLWIIAAAKAGHEDGCHMMGHS